MVVRPPESAPHCASQLGPLVLESLGRARRELRLSSQQCTIGSAPSCTIRLRGATLDPVHCQILRGRSRTIIRSLSAKTWLNGSEFQQDELRPGDVLKIGPLQLRVVATGVAEVDEPPAIETPTACNLTTSLEQLESGIEQLQQDTTEQPTAVATELEEPVESKDIPPAKASDEQPVPAATQPPEVEPVAESPAETVATPDDSLSVSETPGEFLTESSNDNLVEAAVPSDEADDQVVEEAALPELSSNETLSAKDEVAEATTLPEQVATPIVEAPAGVCEEETTEAVQEFAESAPVAESPVEDGVAENEVAKDEFAETVEAAQVAPAPASTFRWVPIDSNVENVEQFAHDEPLPQRDLAAEVRREAEILWQQQQAVWQSELQSALAELQNKSCQLDQQLAQVAEQRQALASERERWEEHQLAERKWLEESRVSLHAELVALHESQTEQATQREELAQHAQLVEQQIAERTAALEEQLSALAQRREALTDDYNQWKQEIAAADEQHAARAQYVEQRLATWEAKRQDAETSLSERHAQMEDELAELRAEWKILRQRQDALVEANPALAKNRTAQIDHRLAEVRAEREAFEHQRRPVPMRHGRDEVEDSTPAKPEFSADVDFADLLLADKEPASPTSAEAESKPELPTASTGEERGIAAADTVEATEATPAADQIQDEAVSEESLSRTEPDTAPDTVPDSGPETEPVVAETITDEATSVPTADVAKEPADEASEVKDVVQRKPTLEQHEVENLEYRDPPADLETPNSLYDQVSALLDELEQPSVAVCEPEEQTENKTAELENTAAVVTEFETTDPAVEAVSDVTSTEVLVEEPQPVVEQAPEAPAKPEASQGKGASLTLSDILSKYGRKGPAPVANEPATTVESAATVEPTAAPVEKPTAESLLSSLWREDEREDAEEEETAHYVEPEVSETVDEAVVADDVEEDQADEPHIEEAHIEEAHEVEPQDAELVEPEEESAPAEDKPAETSARLAEDGEEESIDEYMAKLMARVRGLTKDDSPKSNPAPAQKSAGSESDSATKVEPSLEKKSESVPAAPKPSELTDSEFRPRAVAPEKTDHLSAMRELANKNARMALDSHTRKMLLANMRWKLVIALVALFTCFFLMWVATWQGTIAYFGAVTSMVIAVVWGLQYLMLMTQFLARGGDHDDEFDDDFDDLDDDFED